MVTKRKYPRISTDDWPACCPPCTRKANEKTGAFYRKLKFRDVERPPTATGHRSWQEVSLPGRSSTTCNPQRQFGSGDGNRTRAAGTKTGPMEFRFRQRHTGG